jgi:hypothetical protein
MQADMQPIILVLGVEVEHSQIWKKTDLTLKSEVVANFSPLSAQDVLVAVSESASEGLTTSAGLLRTKHASDGIGC